MPSKQAAKKSVKNTKMNKAPKKSTPENEPEVTVEWTQLGESYDYDMHYLMGWYEDTSPSGNALDETDNVDIPILAYSAKYASGLYGPFREAVNVSLENSDRKSYQQDWRNKREAMNEIKADLDEGADMIMVKPAITYLDIIAQARELTDVPIGAYHVSGEYSMIKAAGEKGWIDDKQVAIEQLTAVKRSGANFILTYFAKEIAECL